MRPSIQNPKTVYFLLPLSIYYLFTGTPSLALPSTVAKVIDTVKRLVTFDPDSEVTLEANPTKLETERLM